MYFFSGTSSRVLLTLSCVRWALMLLCFKWSNTTVISATWQMQLLDQQRKGKSFVIGLKIVSAF